jgi:hypothetical protein
VRLCIPPLIPPHCAATVFQIQLNTNAETAALNLHDLTSSTGPCAFYFNVSRAGGPLPSSLDSGLCAFEATPTFSIARSFFLRYSEAVISCDHGGAALLSGGNTSALQVRFATHYMPPVPSFARTNSTKTLIIMPANSQSPASVPPVAMGHWAARKFVLHSPPAYNQSDGYVAACLCRFPNVFFIGDSTVRQLFYEASGLDPKDTGTKFDHHIPCGTRARFIFHALPVYASRPRAFVLPGENDLLEKLIVGRIALPGGALVIISLGHHFVQCALPTFERRFRRFGELLERLHRDRPDVVVVWRNANEFDSTAYPEVSKRVKIRVVNSFFLRFLPPWVHKVDVQPLVEAHPYEQGNVHVYRALIREEPQMIASRACCFGAASGDAAQRPCRHGE